MLGVCGKGQGVCGKGQGVCDKGWGVLGKGHGVCGKGQGVCGKGQCSHFMKVEYDCKIISFTRNTMYYGLVSRPQKEGP